ncbi:hypothetical protein P885DRAFT_79088 [Corynascus similis CBS 632.67]
MGFPEIDRHYDTHAKLVSTFTGFGLTFCPGLLEVIQSPTPVSVSWFESLPDFIPKNVWGVYAIILRKPGYLPLVYIGSGTSVYRGVRTRIQEHKTKVLKLKAAYDKGYKRTRIVVLAHYAIPKASQVPFIRPAILVLEAVFNPIF